MIRPLNIDELDDKIHSYALDVEYIEKQHLLKKLHEFLNFIDSQPISSRIVERIEEDYNFLTSKFPTNETQSVDKQIRELRESIKTPDEQGALGYFLIRETSKLDKYNENSYLEMTRSFFNCHGDYNKIKNDFNTLIFKPFVELLKWYIYDSQSRNSEDYFSKHEIDEFSEKLDKLRDDIRLGQEVLFEELQDLKEQLKNLNKKNWGELLKGKLFDMTMSKIISFETFEIIFKFIVGEDIKILGN
jgi:hypothetical protein